MAGIFTHFCLLTEKISNTLERNSVKLIENMNHMSAQENQHWFSLVQTIYRESGLVLLELLLSMVISIGFLTLALEYSLGVFKKYQSWHVLSIRTQQWINWDSWVRHSLDNRLAHRRCGENGEKSQAKTSQFSVALHKEKKTGSDILTLHSCFFYHGKWQWIDKRYYTKKKKKNYTLYEKTESDSAQAMLLGVKRISVKCLEKHVKTHPFLICRIELKWQKSIYPMLMTTGVYTFHA